MPVYLDHNATCPCRPRVVRAMADAAARIPGNPSSVHRFGQEARTAVDAARRAVNALIGGDSGDLVFTGSGTESVHLGIVGAAEAVPGLRRLVISGIEHAAGRDAAGVLGARGWDVAWIAPDADGRIDPCAVEAALDPAPALVSVMHANNETGVVQPVAEIAARCRARGVRFHVDAVQSVGKIPVTPEAWGADLVSVAAHKMGGPPGVGALWKRREVPLRAIVPGSQEGGRRGGTHAVPAIVGFGEAAREVAADMAERGARLTVLREGFEARVAERLPGARITGIDAPRLPNTTHLTFDPACGTDLVVALDLDGYAVSSGSACRAGSTEPSPVLLAMGIDAARARTAVRVSLGPETAEADLDGFLDALARRTASAANPAGTGA
jgi:cysteine desulfurase